MRVTFRWEALIKCSIRVSHIISIPSEWWNASSRTQHRSFHIQSAIPLARFPILKLATAECLFCLETPHSSWGSVTSKFTIKRTNWNWRKVSDSFEKWFNWFKTVWERSILKWWEILELNPNRDCIFNTFLQFVDTKFWNKILAK